MAQALERIIAFGAHPDDCEWYFGGAAAKFAKAGFAVKFVSLANGDAGHHTMQRSELARRRYAEAQEAGRRLGIAEYEIMDYHDGEVMPTLEARAQVIRAIRRWNADIVLSHRPNDYHPDHRYTGVLVQDAAYLVLVPLVAPEVPPLRENPIFLYYADDFQNPAPFRPDVAVDVDDVWQTKVDSLDAHVSQMYEWLPWVEGVADQVPADAAARRAWLAGVRPGTVSPAIRRALERRYGVERANKIRRAEAFELCEYGRRASLDELQNLFPR